MESLKGLATLIRKNRRDILLICVWTAAITAVFIESHQQFYIDNPIMTYRQIGFSEVRAPTTSPLDCMLILFTSLVISVFLISAKGLILGYAASLLLSSLIAVIYTFLFNWYVLDLGRSFSQLPFGWEWVVFQGVINTFRFMFPLAVTFSLIGVCIGSIVRMLTNRG
jgi:hypothetical protein